MELRRPLSVLGLLFVFMVACHAAMPSEIYWNTMLPNTSMPLAIKNILRPGEALSVQNGHLTRIVPDDRQKYGKHYGEAAENARIVPDDRQKYGKHYGEAAENVRIVPDDREKYGKHYGEDAQLTHIVPDDREKYGKHYGEGAQLTHIVPDDREKYGKHYGEAAENARIVPDDREKYGKHYGEASENARIVPDDREKYGKHYGDDGINEIASHLYLLEKDIIPGTQMNVYFKRSPSRATFLPREVADSIPFSSNKLPQILDIFSVKPNSIEAGIISKVITDCEEPANEGEERVCATSLESMVDFSVLKLGKKPKAFSTQVERKKDDKIQLYTFTSGVKKIGSSKSVVCHDMNYAYAVFYCHEVPETAAYIVPLVGADGSSANAIVVCHENTSTWNPKHLAFQVLKVKPGGAAVCHFLVEETVLWSGN